MLSMIGQHKFGLVRKFFASPTAEKLCGQCIPMQESMRIEFFWIFLMKFYLSWYLLQPFELLILCALMDMDLLM